jgi:uncharacterized protein (TIGR03067 family)
MKTRFAWSVVVGFVLAAPLLRGGQPAKDKEALQGTWQMVEMQYKGEAGPMEIVDSSKVVFKGDKMDLHFGKEEPRQFTFKLDPAKTPKHIDMTAVNGPFKGTTGLSIYRLNKDTFTLVISNRPNDPRPTEFKAPEGSILAVMTFKKVNEK